jgi:hypothetical protein
MKRPPFDPAWKLFMDVKKPANEVGEIIGGNVKKNIDSHIFENACPIRMSYVLNKSGFPIPKNSGYASASGSDGEFYIFRVNDMTSYLAKAFGKPDKTIKSPVPSDFYGMKGIIAVRGHGWSNAKGHITLWNGNHCSDTCHLMYDPDNGPFVPETASLWTLP